MLALGCEGPTSVSGVPPPTRPGSRVEIEGRIAGLSGACPNLSFSVRGSSIVTNGATEFKRITCQILADDVEVDIDGVVQASGSVLALEVEPEEDFRVLSVINGLAGSCPNISFSIGTERILATLATRFDEVTCGMLRNGLQLEVRGVRRGDGSVVATRIRLDDDD
jgi:hypothetical protein